MKNMKKWLTALLCTLMCMVSFAAVVNAATTTYKPAKRIDRYYLENGKYVLESTTKYTYRNGELKSYVYTSGDYSSKTVYKGNKTLNYTNGKLYSTTKRTMKNGLAVKSVTKYQDGSTSTTKYTYNKKGLMSKSVTTSANGSVSTTKYTYNKKGLMTRSERTNQYNTSVNTYKYNKKGWETESKYTYTSLTGNYTYSTLYKSGYYTSGKKKGLVKQTTDIWEEDGDTSSSTYNYSYKLNKDGTIKEEIRTNSYGDTYKSVYKY